MRQNPVRLPRHSGWRYRVPSIPRQISSVLSVLGTEPSAPNGSRQTAKLFVARVLYCRCTARSSSCNVFRPHKE